MTFKARACPAVLPDNGLPIMFVGERPGADEEYFGRPLVGSSGDVFDRLLNAARIPRKLVALDNVFSWRPPEDYLGNWLLTKDELDVEAVPEEFRPWARIPLEPGKYLAPEFYWELARLRSNIEQYKPNVVVAMGAVAVWAVARLNGVNTNRGVTIPARLVDRKCVCTYNPAYVLRQWDVGFITCLADFTRARREMETPDIIRPVRRIIVEPTLDDLDKFYDEFIKGAELVSFDIETTTKYGGILKCIGFAPDDEIALVLPFHDYNKPDHCYWRTAAEERKARDWVARILEDPTIPKLGHNGLYDIQWCYQKLGINIRNYAHDTMLLHHSLFLEFPKKLGILGSIYTNEGAWKNMTRGEKFAREK